METIQAFAIPPWADRMQVYIPKDRVKTRELAAAAQGAIIITVSASERNGMVGVGGVASDTRAEATNQILFEQSLTLGSRDQLNPYVAELHAFAMTIAKLPRLRNRMIVLQTSNQSALQALNKPRQQSGQSIIRKIYKLLKLHKSRQNIIIGTWAPIAEFGLGKKAKDQAKKSTRTGQCATTKFPYAKSTVINRAIRELIKKQSIPPGVGEY
jgi:hypothetical protein